jgi:hypothetical protein
VKGRLELGISKLKCVREIAAPTVMSAMTPFAPFKFLGWISKFNASVERL